MKTAGALASNVPARRAASAARSPPDLRRSDATVIQTATTSQTASTAPTAKAVIGETVIMKCGDPRTWGASSGLDAGAEVYPGSAKALISRR
ncbi:MAG: hypothetical protein LC634_01310 [Sphingomonadales bacterium]|nr:hypothetical protein [Sphingomonadales bacterium]